MNILITSTGSNTGKTVFSAGIAAVMQSLGYEMGVFKPVQVGCKYANNKQFSPDLNFVKRIDPNIKTYASYSFKKNAIPAIAADLERVSFSMEQVLRDYNEAKKENDILIVESTGGLLTPLTGRLTMADLAIALHLPTIIIADVEQDFMNQTLLTIKTAELCGLDILGVVLNRYNPKEANNPHHQEVKLLEQLLTYEILGAIPNIDIIGEGINPETLISEILLNVNLAKVFSMEIPKLIF